MLTLWSCEWRCRCCEVVTNYQVWSKYLQLFCLPPLRRRRHRVVVEDRSVAPVWPRWMAARHKSAGGRWWSWRSWSIQWLRGRPELRTQSRSGRLPTDASTCSLSVWWAGMLGDILAMCPKMGFTSSPDALHHWVQACTSLPFLTCNSPRFLVSLFFLLPLTDWGLWEHRELHNTNLLTQSVWFLPSLIQDHSPIPSFLIFFVLNCRWHRMDNA